MTNKESSDIKSDEKKYNYKSFCPDNQGENFDVYYEMFDQIYKNDKIKNVAITGIYGAGKSTLWNSYVNKKQAAKDEEKEKWSNKKILLVSLADFNNIYKESSTDEKKELTNKVEKQIINQILYQIDYDKIPLSQFNLKQINIENKLILNIYLLCLIIGFFMLFTSNNIIHSIELHGSLNLAKNTIVIFLPLFLVGFPLFKFIHKFFPKLMYNIQKINVKGTEVNLNYDFEGVIYKALHEIIYLIKASKAHTVVFEDLDRFDDIDLFIKLREINILINKNIDSNIKFIYMIKDSLFSFRDRTKFFDIIVPIVPFINSQNSKGKLIELFYEQSDNIVYPDDNIIERVSLFLDDMRTVYSIRNEYEIYAQYIDIESRKLDANKLFGLIVFKNVFPKEFEDLQHDRGYICELFKYVDTTIRKEMYENSNINKKLKIEIKLMKISEILNGIENQKLYNIFNDEKFSDYSDLLNNQHFELIKLLVLEGLIDETYIYYRGRFIEGTLCESDERFLMYLSINESLGIDYKLHNPELVADKLNGRDINKSAVYNTMLLDILIKNKNKEKLHKVVSAILNDKNTSLIFHEYLHTLFDNKKGDSVEEKITLDDFLALMIPEKTNEINKIMKNCENTSTYNLFKSYMAVKSLINITDFNKDNLDVSELITYINSNTKIMKILNKKELIDSEKFIDIIIKNNIKFKNLSENDVSLNSKNLEKMLLEKILENNLYEISFENSIFLISKILESKEDEIFKNYYYYLMNDRFKVMSEYLTGSGKFNEVFSFYFETVKNNSKNIFYSKRTVLIILNDERMDNANKSKLLKYNKSKVQDITEIRNINIWEDIINYDRLAYSQDNIEKLYNSFIDENIIVKYLNNYINVSRNIIIKYNDFIISILNNPTTSDDLFDYFVNKSRDKILKINKNLDINKIDKLINNKIIEVNEYNFLSLVELYNLNDKSRVKNKKYKFDKIIQYLSSDIIKSSSIIINLKIIRQITKSNVIKILNSNIFDEETNKKIVDIVEYKFDSNDINNMQEYLKRYILNNN